MENRGMAGKKKKPADGELRKEKIESKRETG